MSALSNALPEAVAVPNSLSERCAMGDDMARKVCGGKSEAGRLRQKFLAEPLFRRSFVSRPDTVVSHGWRVGRTLGTRSHRAHAHGAPQKEFSSNFFSRRWAWKRCWVAIAAELQEPPGEP